MNLNLASLLLCYGLENTNESLTWKQKDHGYLQPEGTLRTSPHPGDSGTTRDLT